MKFKSHSKNFEIKSYFDGACFLHRIGLTQSHSWRLSGCGDCFILIRLSKHLTSSKKHLYKLLVLCLSNRLIYHFGADGWFLHSANSPFLMDRTYGQTNKSELIIRKIEKDWYLDYPFMLFPI